MFFWKLFPAFLCCGHGRAGSWLEADGGGREGCVSGTPFPSTQRKGAPVQMTTRNRDRNSHWVVLEASKRILVSLLMSFECTSRNMQITGGICTSFNPTHLQVEERWDSRSCDLSKDLLSSSRGGVKFLQIFWTSNKPLEMLGKGDSKETRTHCADGLGAERGQQSRGRGLLSDWDHPSSLPLPSCEMLVPLAPPPGLGEFEPQKLFRPRKSPSRALTVLVRGVSMWHDELRPSACKRGGCAMTHAHRWHGRAA